jgi:hypothetical protein
MLDIVQDYLTAQKYSFERLDGSIRGSERFDALHRFSSTSAQVGDCPPAFVFLLSVRAGGQGLNLTQADTCIFLDSDFNPQVDLQAEDRVHRIGQEKPVLVIRLLSQKTVEEGILLSARKKAAVAQQILSCHSEDSFNTVEGEPRELLDAILVGAQAAIDENPPCSSNRGSSSSPDNFESTEPTVADAAAQCKDSFDRHFASCDWSRILAQRFSADENGEFVTSGCGAAYELEYQPLELGGLHLNTSHLRRRVSAAIVVSGRDGTVSSGSRPRQSRDAPPSDAVPAASASKAEKRLAKWAAAGYVSRRLSFIGDEKNSLDLEEVVAACEDDSVAESVLFVVGDVARPSYRAGFVHFILHCVDASGTWPERGVFKALDDAFGTAIKDSYHFASRMKDLHLGDAHCVTLRHADSVPGTVTGIDSIVLLVCLQRLSDGSRRIDLPSFHRGIVALRLHCSSLGAGLRFQFHTPMPPPPCPWYAAERDLRSQLVHPLRATISVYYFRRASGAGVGGVSAGSAVQRESQTSRLARCFFSEPGDAFVHQKSTSVVQPQSKSTSEAPPQHRAQAVAASTADRCPGILHAPSTPHPLPPAAPIFDGLLFALHQLAWGTASLQVSGLSLLFVI